MNVLVLDPFASHVVRALFTVLCPSLFASDPSIVRSKRSATWKSKQGEFKSVFTDEKEKGKAAPLRTIPVMLTEMSRRIIVAMRDNMDANEVRSLAANKASCPVLQVRRCHFGLNRKLRHCCSQMAIQVEANIGMADEPGSLMDRVLVGLITLHSV
jgi:nucleolar protein 9